VRSNPSAPARVNSAEPFERPLSAQGKHQAEDKRGYLQVFHTAGKEVPRSLPYSEDAEKGVLCSLLLSSREVGDQLLSLPLRSRSD